MSANDIERLIAGLALRGINGTRFLQQCGVDPDDFTDKELHLVLSVAFTLAMKGIEPTALEVLRDVAENGKDDDLKPFAGGSRKEKLESFERLLDRLSEDFKRLSIQTTPQGAAEYLKSQAARRKAETLARNFYMKLTNGANINETLTGTISELLTFNSSLHNVDGIVRLVDASNAAFKDAEEEAEGRVVSLSTGYKQLDRMLHNLHGGRLYGIGAEEKEGKSLLTASIAFNVAKAGIPVGLVSLEMRDREIAARLAGCSETATARDRASKLARFKTEVCHYPFFIRSGGVSAAKLIASAYELVLKYKARLLIVDYLQLVKMDGKHERVNEINETVASLKTFAMAFDIPVILVSAANNKQIYGRLSKKPTPADLRDSGRIANDCDVLMFLWTPNVESAPSYRELYISRGRNGESGTVGLTLNTQTLRFEETDLKVFTEHAQQNSAW